MLIFELLTGTPNDSPHGGAVQQPTAAVQSPTSMGAPMVQPSAVQQTSSQSPSQPQQQAGMISDFFSKPQPTTNSTVASPTPTPPSTLGGSIANKIPGIGNIHNALTGVNNTISRAQR